MRNLPPRPTLPQRTLTKLQTKTQLIVQVQDIQQRKDKARTIFNSSRDKNTAWFKPVVDALRSLSGTCQFCMYCSANEPSQVEHYRSLTVFPELAMDYQNYLWTCDICNRSKGDRFPPDTETGAQILNPLDDQVWDHFFLDENFGRLVQRLDPNTGQPLPRAVSTCNVVHINRENVQIRRQHRFKDLRRDIQTALDGFLSGTKTIQDLRTEIADQRNKAFQPDVADFFLNGPGRTESPFHATLIAVGEITP